MKLSDLSIRRPVLASIGALRMMLPVFSTIVVVPVLSASSAATCTINVFSSP